MFCFSLEKRVPQYCFRTMYIMYKQRIVLVVVDKVPPRPPMPRDLAPPRPPPPETDTEDEEAFPTPQANQPIMVKNATSSQP